LSLLWWERRAIEADPRVLRLIVRAA